MISYAKNKVEYLVADTTAFLNKVALQELSENVLTVPQVIKEIKSKRQLRRLIVLPYDLSVKEAFPENIKFIIEFSKKTGDYVSLSATDINVIALTYQLEKEKNGISHLNKSPVSRPTIQSTASIPNNLKNIPGFYTPKKEYYSQTQSLESEEASEYDSAEEEQCDSAELEQSDSAEKLKSFNLIKQNGDSNGQELCEKIIENYPQLKAEIKNECYESHINDADKAWAKEEEENYDESDKDSDDSYWITPSNIEKAKIQTTSELKDDLQNVSVACLTTDFAMQNVLKQIGLHVISLDGKLVKQLRTFILRCYGCFKTTSIMTKVFCPNCGNKTLKKVAISVDENGFQHLHINFKKPLTARGKKYSLPHFKGGKHSNNPILFEDQPVPQQKPSHLSRIKNNPLNDDYIAGYSPFVTRDVTSKSALLGIKPHLEVKNWARKNPNEARKKKK